ncbi:hypothetical protein [Massilia niabensis]|uniref:Uncharacterized protein n=1 Tax=Massilia niabensis TaxID=544910 RepID=A0ABW0LDW6_9BURK
MPDLLLVRRAYAAVQALGHRRGQRKQQVLFHVVHGALLFQARCGDTPQISFDQRDRRAVHGDIGSCQKLWRAPTLNARSPEPASVLLLTLHPEPEALFDGSCF